MMATAATEFTLVSGPVVRLVEAVEPVLKHSGEGAHPDPLLFDQLAETITVDEVDRWRCCRRGLPGGGREASQGDEDRSLGTSGGGVTLEERHNLPAESTTWVVTLRLHRHPRRKYRADGSQADPVRCPAPGTFSPDPWPVPANSGSATSSGARTLCSGRRRIDVPQ